MAKDPTRTERATPKRRQQAREEGSVPRSADFDAALILWGNFFLLLGLGGATVTALGEQLARFLALARPGILTSGGDQALVWEVGRDLFKILGPYLGLNFLLAVVGGIAQRGWHPSGKPLVPKFTRLNPAQGFQRLFSARSVVELIKSVLKLLVLSWVAWRAVAPHLPGLLDTSRMPLPQALALLKATLFVLYRNTLLAMLAIAVADFLYQRHTFEESIKMTKQEVKDEMKDQEGNAEVKRQQRSIMMAAARRRMIAAVPKATVVVTNPTHVAVALRYDAETAAPVCVAKGLDHLALKIREKAKEHGITILERPELARALYRQVDVDRAIPAELYQAVAQVIAFVYRLKGAA